MALSASDADKVPDVLCATLDSVSVAVEVPVMTAASLVPLIVTVTTWLVPSAVVTVIESV